MKAVLFTQFGGPEVLTYADAPDPILKQGEVLVDIHAASVNAADTKVRQGAYASKPPLPHKLGRDFSGVIRATNGTTDFAVGDAVFGVLPPGVEGTYAEQLAIDPAIIAARPDSITHAQAAALALTGLTAIWATEDTARLQPGETILIQGGAGGVAGFAIQLAHHLGARVITTASPANHAYVRSLGADQVIDYTADDFAKTAPPCDVVFDTVGGEVQARSYEVLKPGGRLVWIAPAPPGFQPPRTDIQLLRPAVTRDRAHLERMLALVRAGAIKPPPMRLFELSGAAEAHRISDSRHLQGKLVFAVRT